MCEVCGLHWEGATCPRCGTVLQVGRARCAICQKELAGPIARCDQCGAATPELEEVPEDAIQRLTALPGIDDRTARRLFARGFSDPADLLGIALPEHAVRQGLHHTLARKLTLQALKVAPRIRKEVPCAICETPKPAANAICPACGVRGEREPTPEEIRAQIAQVIGEVRDLAADPDFLGMPAELRDEIMDAFSADVVPARNVQVESSAYANQFEDWRARGIDTLLLERLLVQEGEESFRRNYAGILRRQVTKRREGGRFWCAICNEELAADEPECENCGAKFR